MLSKENCYKHMTILKGIPGWCSGKEPTCRRCRRPRFDPWVGRIPCRRAWQPTLAFLPGESHGQRSLAGYSLWGRKESDSTEHTIRERLENLLVATKQGYLKEMSLLFNTLSRLVITFLPRSKRFSISWLQITICSDFGAPQK